MKNLPQNLRFVTTSASKFQEIRSWLAQLRPDIAVEQCVLDIPEIQSLDPAEVALAKAKEAWRQIQKPILIDDAGLFLDAYPQFPGTLTKSVHQAIGIEGILQIAGVNRKAQFRSHLLYMESPDNYYLFEGVTRGSLISPFPERDQSKPLHCSDLLVPEGYDRTFAELQEAGEAPDYHYRYDALKKFCDSLLPV